MQDIPATPASTLIRARNIAIDQGLHYVYTGNVHHQQGDTTFCSGCNTALIVRDWYQINHYHLTQEGGCPTCSTPVAGRFDLSAGDFGRKRIPISIREYRQPTSA
jgi:pyruvate formate lyase activating enzyme